MQNSYFKYSGRLFNKTPLFPIFKYLLFLVNLFIEHF